jgi:ClpP class serine protease
MIELLQYRQWAINEAYMRVMTPRVLDAIKHGVTLIEKKTQADYEVRIESLFAAGADEDMEVTYSRDASTDFPIAKVGSKNIILMSVIGPLSKYGGMCSMGMQDYAKVINMMNANTNIHGMVMIIDSPGGTVDGTPELALTIKNSVKPIGVFGDGMVASAALWIASQSSVIVGNKNNPTEFGSIGTLMVTENYTNMMDAGNYPKVKIHRAPQSTEKALVNYVEEITDELQQSINGDLKEITDLFISAVTTGRGETLDTQADGLFKGRMFSVGDSKKMGLIDAVGTLQTAINKVAQLARGAKLEAGSLTKPNAQAEENMSLKKHVLGLFGFKSEQADSLSDEQAIQATEEKIAELQANLTSAVEAKAALEARISALETEASASTASVAAKEAEITELKEALAKAPAATVTTVVANEVQEAAVAGDADGATSQKGKYRTPTDDEADAYVSQFTSKN